MKKRTALYERPSRRGMTPVAKLLDGRVLEKDSRGRFYLDGREINKAKGEHLRWSAPYVWMQERWVKVGRASTIKYRGRTYRLATHDDLYDPDRPWLLKKPVVSKMFHIITPDGDVYGPMLAPLDNWEAYLEPLAADLGYELDNLQVESGPPPEDLPPQKARFLGHEFPDVGERHSAVYRQASDDFDFLYELDARELLDILEKQYPTAFKAFKEARIESLSANLSETLGDEFVEYGMSKGELVERLMEPFPGDPSDEWTVRKAIDDLHDAKADGLLPAGTSVPTRSQYSRSSRKVLSLLKELWKTYQTNKAERVVEENNEAEILEGLAAYAYVEAANSWRDDLEMDDFIYATFGYGGSHFILDALNEIEDNLSAKAE